MPANYGPALSRASMAGAGVLLLVAPFHAVAYLRDEGYEGQGAIHWAEAAFEAVPAIWDWSGSHDVYLWFGRVFAVALVLMLIPGAVALHSRQRGRAARFERWSFRAFALAATLLSLGVILEYYTPFTDQVFLAVALPGLALTLLTGTFFGIATARAGAIPTWLGVLLALSFLPGVPLSVALLGHIPIGFSANAIAWILIGIRLLRNSPAPRPSPAT